jgi:hypothetical protein
MFRAKLDQESVSNKAEIMIQFDPSDMETTLMASSSKTSLDKRRKFSRYAHS